MLRRTLPLLLVIGGAGLGLGCSGEAPPAGAARVVVAWTDFAPGCVRLSAWDDLGGEAGAERAQLGLQDGAREGSRLFAVYRQADWGPTVHLRAEALEGNCAEGQVVARAEATVTIEDALVEQTFALSASDVDGDGFVSSASAVPGRDCDDGDPEIRPGQLEVCDGIDQDCDGQLDEDVGSPWYLDADADGFGDPARVLLACALPQGYVAEPGDCDDGRADVHPGAAELCDGRDNDCNDSVDDGVVVRTWYLDADSDGHGDLQSTHTGCAPPDGYVAAGDDCDDGAATVFPGATEVCNTVDDDCDGTADEEVLVTWFRDDDGDGWGQSGAPQKACTQPSGYAPQNNDCDDGNPDRNPGAMEACNTIDDDCDAEIDEGVTVTLYRDADGDGFGNAASTQLACGPSSGWVADATDCNDANAAVNPGQTEICNTVDDNCNGQIDEGVLQTFYRDEDEDGEGDPNATVSACTAGPRRVTNSTDCDDGNPYIRTAQAERCDGMDNDCDGQIDPGTTCAGAQVAIPSHSGGGDHDWRTVSVYTPGKAWTSGRNDKLRHFDGDANTTDEDGDCSGDWDGAWAAGNGTVYLAGRDNGELAEHGLGGGCGAILPTTSSQLRALAGFATANGPLLFAAGDDGRVIRWQTWLAGGSGVTEFASISGVRLRDIDGASAASLIVVGRKDGATDAPFVAHRANNTFTAATLPAGLPSGTLRRLSVVRSDLAFAVGDAGMVLKWDGTSWTSLPGISGAPSLHAVKAFGKNLVYVAGGGAAGYAVWRWDGVAWTSVHTLPADMPRDLGGTSPWDMWVVGDNGLVRHYSAP